MNNIPKKYHSQVRKLIKKAREEGYQKGRSDCPCLSRYRNPEVAVWVGEKKDIPKGWKKISEEKAKNLIKKEL